MFAHLTFELGLELKLQDGIVYRRKLCLSADVGTRLEVEEH